MNKTSVSPAVKLESKPCSRCGGEGKLWHFSNVHGGVCFKCNGAKNILTKRGAEASRYLVELRSVRADALVVGQLVRETTTTSGLNSVTSFFTVASLWSIVDGKPFIPANTLKVELTHNKWGDLGTQYPADKLVRVACSAEFKAATLRQALAYQATLTKSGTPTKATEAFLASNPSASLPANILEKKI